MLDGFCRRVAAFRLDSDGFCEEILRELFDVIGECGREQQRLALFWQQREDALEVGHEAHIQHAVCLVQNQYLHLIEHQVAAFDVIQQAPGGCHQNFHAFCQRGFLRFDVDAAEHHGRAQRDMLGVGFYAFFDLYRQFTRRSQDQCANRVACRRGAIAGMRQQALQQRQREGRRLAGAGLRHCHQVASCQNLGDSLRLDRCRLSVTFFLNGPQNLRVEVER